MGIFSFLSGGVPSTAKIEEAEAALLKDYNEFNEFITSEELKRYEELDKQVNTPEFAEKKKSIMAQNFKITEEYKKEQEYLSMKKSKTVKDYYKTKSSGELEQFKQVDGSDEPKKLEKLASYVTSAEFAEEKEKAGKEFKGTEAANKEQEYFQLKKSASLKKYFKFKDSPKYKNFIAMDGSEEIAKYEELEKYIVTEAFKKVKEYMSLSAKKKYEQSEESKLEEEYNTLKKSEKINWFFKLKKKNEFNRITDWELTFEDDFNEGSLDAKKWMTNYFWGDVLLKDTYALPGDKQLYTDGKNIEISDSILKIVTRKETGRGKLWNPILGFKETDFDYTSGLISTGKSFRQKYGKFQAKIRLKNVPIRQAAWMLGDTILPHVDLIKYDKKKINQGMFWGNIADKSGLNKKLFKSGGGKYTSDFFIYTIEWSPDKIVWKINDKETLTQTDNIPQDPLYMVFSAGVTGSVPESQLPASLEIDYVKIYRKKEQA